MTLSLDDSFLSVGTVDVSVSVSDSQSRHAHIGSRVELFHEIVYLEDESREGRSKIVYYGLRSVDGERELYRVERKKERLYLVEHLGRLLEKKWLGACRGSIVAVEHRNGAKGLESELCIVCRFECLVDVDLWRPDASAAAFLLHLKPQGELTGESMSDYERLKRETEEWLGDLGDDELMSLRMCVTRLPAPKEESISSQADLISSENGSVNGDVFPVNLLPEEILFRVLGMLDVASLQNLAQTCRYFRFMCAEITPGLLLRLYPHQRAAIRFMLDRERPVQQRIVHPCWRFFRTADGLTFWGNTSTGEISEDCPVDFSDFRGGFLCDDPGLGKTITCLGLITRTKGCLCPLDGDQAAEVFWYGGDTTRQYGYIEVSQMSSSNENERQRSVRRKLAAASKYSPYKEAVKSRTVASKGESSKKKKLDFTKEDGNLVDVEVIADDKHMQSEKDLWLQCELCSKWRRVPQGTCDADKAWCCYLHPNSRMRSCDIFAEKLHADEEVVEINGWVTDEEEQGTKANVEYFKEVLAAHGELFSLYGRYRTKGRTILHWLMTMNHRSFDAPFRLPIWGQQPPGFGVFMKKIGFVPSDRKRPNGFHPSARTKHDFVSWKRSPSLSAMYPDLEALAIALDFDPQTSKIKVFLSLSLIHI